MSSKKPSKKARPSAPKVPKATKGDTAHALVKGGIGAIPGIGSPLAEAFALAIGAPLEKRRQEWMESVAEMLDALSQEVDGVSVEELANDEDFVSTVLAITAVAIRTHQREKLDALRNAIAQAALGKIPDYDERSLLLNILDRMTAMHLAVLRVFADPRQVAGAEQLQNFTMASLHQVVMKAIPPLGARKDIAELIWRSLSDDGLMSAANYNVSMSGHGLLQKRTTELGDRLIAFVSRPEYLTGN